MTQASLQPDVSGFSPIPPEKVVQAYLACSKQQVSAAQVQKNLRALLSSAEVDGSVSILVERGEAILEQKSVCLTPSGKASALRAPNSKKEWGTVRSNLLPLITLGLDPNNSGIRQKFTKPDAIAAAVIVIAFSLPKEIMASAKMVQSEIVWRILRGALPDMVGKGPFPAIEKPGTVERTLLAGLAGRRAKTITEAFSALAAHAAGAEKTGIDALRERLVRVGLAQSERSATQNMPDVLAANGKGGFAGKVNGVATKLSTPPFHGRVAIAQVYDAYGKFYPDAGSLEKFKERLVEAARKREIQLGRLDLPERMGRDLRERSETRWDRDDVHFVITNWK